MGTRFPFRQDQLSTFLQLVNDSNPGLVLGPLTSADLRTLTPTALATPDAFGRDTSVRLQVKPNNAKYFGSQTVTYRRISLGYLFRNMGNASSVQGFPVVAVNAYPKYTANYTVQDLCDELNSKYGLTLTMYDFNSAGTNTTLLTGSGVAWVNITTYSLCYKSQNTDSPQSGAIQIQWTKPLPPLSYYFSATPQLLTGRLYPGGNSFPTDGSRKPQADYFLYGADGTSLATTFSALAASGTSADFTTTALAPILSWMQRMRPDLNFSSANCATAGGMNGVTFTKYSLDNVNLRQANALKYTNAIVFTPPASGSCWFQGQLIIHYTLRSGSLSSVIEGVYQPATVEFPFLLLAASVNSFTTTMLGTKDAAAGWSVPGIRATKTADSVSQNTKARVQIGASNTSIAPGYKDVFFDRLDLASLAKFTPYKVSMVPGVSVMTVLDTIRDQYGVRFTTDDISDVQTVDRDGDGKYTTVTLTAKATSLGWFGSVTLTFLGLPDISTAFLSQSLGGF